MIAPNYPSESKRGCGYTRTFPKWEWEGHPHVPADCESCSVLECWKR